MQDIVARYMEESIPNPSQWNVSFSLNHTFTQTRLSLCRPRPVPNHHPTLLFSPGLGFPRQVYHRICTEIASWGYSVVTLEVPGQSGIVVYADGTVQPIDPILDGTLDPTDEQLVEANDVRVADLEFVLHSLPSPSFARAHRRQVNLNTSHMALFGHSFGGSASISELMNNNNNTRVLGGANLDGAYFGAPLTAQNSSDKPFLLFASSSHDQTSIPGWASVWEHMDGWKLQLQLRDSGHWCFTDMAYLFELYGVDGIPGVREELTIVLGLIDGRQAFKSVVGAMVSFFEFVFSSSSEGVSVADKVLELGNIQVVNGTDV
jgi:dienelactone hydrolase